MTCTTVRPISTCRGSGDTVVAGATEIVEAPFAARVVFEAGALVVPAGEAGAAAMAALLQTSATVLSMRRIERINIPSCDRQDRTVVMDVAPQLWRDVARIRPAPSRLWTPPQLQPRRVCAPRPGARVGDRRNRPCSRLFLHIRRAIPRCPRQATVAWLQRPRPGLPGRWRLPWARIRWVSPQPCLCPRSD